MKKKTLFIDLELFYGIPSSIEPIMNIISSDKYSVYFVYNNYMHTDIASIKHNIWQNFNTELSETLIIVPNINLLDGDIYITDSKNKCTDKMECLLLNNNWQYIIDKLIEPISSVQPNAKFLGRYNDTLVFQLGEDRWQEFKDGTIEPYINKTIK